MEAGPLWPLWPLWPFGTDSKSSNTVSFCEILILACLGGRNDSVTPLKSDLWNPLKQQFLYRQIPDILQDWWQSGPGWQDWWEEGTCLGCFFSCFGDLPVDLVTISDSFRNSIWSPCRFGASLARARSAALQNLAGFRQDRILNSMIFGSATRVFPPVWFC